MKVVIFCGGKGTRMGEATEKLPKPLIEIGGKPVLWHIMEVYARQGYKDFVLLLGYLGDRIKDYFTTHKPDDWGVDFVDTGIGTLKSDRLKMIQDKIEDEHFFLAYGDDLSDVRLDALLRFHKESGNTISITSVRLVSNFGIVESDEQGKVTRFKEKPLLAHWMNGGYMVAHRSIFDHLDEGELEEEVFEKLVSAKGIGAYRHYGNWKSMNTLKDCLELNKLYKQGRAFWIDAP